MISTNDAKPGTVLDLALDMDIVADLEDGISGRHDLRLNPGAMTLEIVVREWRWGWYLIELARKTISHWSSPLMQRANLL